MKSNRPLKWYAVLITGIAIGLWIDNRNLNIQIDEETEIKYEYSSIIDSLQNEIEGWRHYTEGNEKP